MNIDSLIELRILINSICDGISSHNLNKNLSFSTKTKILFLLESKDMCPIDMIPVLGIAKTNLANLLKNMIDENLVCSYKNLNNTKNVYYRIADNGKQLLKEYKNKLEENLHIKYEFDEKITESIDNIINFLKGERND